MPVGEQALPVRSALLAGRYDQDAVLLFRELLDGEHDRRVRDIDDHVDPVDVEPGAGGLQPDAALF